MGGKKWTNEEINKLKEVWGEHTLFDVARITGRSRNAIHVKAVRLKLGGQFKHGDMMNANQVAKMLGVDNHAVARWIKKHGLPAKQKRIADGKKKKYWVIKYEDLVEWLKNNPDKWTSRNTDELFGIGENWYKEKHKQDLARPENEFYKWTPEEDRTLLFLFYTECLTCKQISQKMKRSAAAIERRLSRLQQRRFEECRNQKANN